MTINGCEFLENKVMISFFNKTTHFFETSLADLEEIKGWKVISGTVLLAIVYNLISAFILNDLLNIELRTTGLDDMSLEIKFIIVVIAGPIFETLIFQCIIIEAFCFFVPGHKLLGLTGSALLFALSHAYSNVYILYALIPGLMFGVLYLTFRNRDKHPVMTVILAHSLINLYAFCHNSF